MGLRVWTIILCFIIIVCEAYSFSKIERDFDSIWMQFKQAYHKKHCKREDHKRRYIFDRALRSIIRHNFEFDLRKQSYRQGLNKYSDMSHKEFVSKFNGFRSELNTRKINQSRRYLSDKHDISLKLPEKLDWRDKNLVATVKDQKACGSCWAFSALGALEAQIMKHGGKMIDLSEQNLIDCTSSYGNKGCAGGLMIQAYEYIIDKGIEAEETYSYTARQGQCKFRKSNIVATCSSYEDISSGNEDDLLMSLVRVGPISVGMDASRPSFQNYKWGVYDDPWCSSERLDHAVLLVGYGSEDGKDYWLVKNSYGTSWGDNGYAKIERNKDNLCGLATQASYPVL